MKPHVRAAEHPLRMSAERARDQARQRFLRRREIVLRQRYGLLLGCLFVLFFVMASRPVAGGRRRWSRRSRRRRSSSRCARAR
jgi:hypothetical protein